MDNGPTQDGAGAESGAGNSSGNQSGDQSGDPGAYSQKIEHQPVAARVPERVGRGVITTGAVVLDTPNEFIVDFLQGMVRPFAVVSRVVMSPAMMARLIEVVGDNLQKYTATFGAPAALPKPPSKRPSIAEIYENFKLPEDQMSGAYANNVRVGHSAAEFFIDFMTDFYPTAAVSSRVFLAPPHVPRVLETLRLANEQFRKRHSPPGASE